MSGFDAVLFDLDGTIADSSDIICRAQAQTCAEFGHPVSPESLRPYVGPPPWFTFGEVTGEPPEVVERMVRSYRALYAELLPQTPVFQPVVGLLERLHAAGMPLALATSKQRAAALRLLELHGLAEPFRVIQGAGDNATSADKAVVVGRALADLRALGVLAERPVLVGDRSHDVEGAARHGVPTILVGWGYGSAEERAAASAVAADVVELEALLSGR
ncbi:haloacid dehalogenase [Enemella dayhoffiae]|uniref:Haloacid dehalogenase n=1 Tax=Enemella dayhoffiae TaxID=2016507 RepID=A0A255GQN2_9ACTN|nr:HAD hydrolase-like protein [Enemella dayhoffiae]OYO18140.1 haloacid dehalogenase [Enemella dayhoffiae]